MLKKRKNNTRVDISLFKIFFTFDVGVIIFIILSLNRYVVDEFTIRLVTILINIVLYSQLILFLILFLFWLFKKKFNIYAVFGVVLWAIVFGIFWIAPQFVGVYYP